MSDLTLKPVLYANRRLTNEEIDAIVGRPKAEPEACPHGVTDGNCKECYEDGCDHCNSPLYVATKCRVCGRVTEPVQEPPCATQECMPSQCPNCASLEAQNTELDRKLADLEQTSLELCETCGWRTLIPGDCCLNCARKPLNDFDALRLITSTVGLLQSAGPVEGLVGIIRAVERAHGIGVDK